MKFRKANALLGAAIGSTLALAALGQDAQTLNKIRVQADGGAG